MDTKPHEPQAQRSNRADDTRVRTQGFASSYCQSIAADVASRGLGEPLTHHQRSRELPTHNLRGRHTIHRARRRAFTTIKGDGRRCWVVFSNGLYSPLFATAARCCMPSRACCRCPHRHAPSGLARLRARR